MGSLSCFEFSFVSSPQHRDLGGNVVDGKKNLEEQGVERVENLTVLSIIKGVWSLSQDSAGR
jgi:hypothetical protein